MPHFINAIIASNFRRLNSPLKLSYAVTYRCNLKCAMCNIWNKAPSAPELTPDDVGRFFHKPHNIYWIGLTGGEPFIREDLPAIVDAILSQQSSIAALHFATNGTLTERVEKLTRHIVTKYPKLKLVFTVSIDGPKDLHNTIRGRNNVWQDALKTYKILKSITNVKPQFGFTISHNNIGRFEETYRDLKDSYPALRFDDITVNIFQRSTFYYENQDMPPLDQDKLHTEINRILTLDREGLTMNNFLRRTYLKLYPAYARTGKSPVKCQSFANTCFIDPYGNLLPCAVYNRKLLNIKNTEHSLNSIWQLKAAKEIHAECAQNKCPSCWSPCDAYSAIGGSLLRSLASR